VRCALCWSSAPGTCAGAPRPCVPETGIPPMTAPKLTPMTDIAEQDLRIDVYDLLADDPKRYDVRITHLPTGTWAGATGAHLLPTRERAMSDLRERMGRS
jgi:hypothetical protein